MKSVAAVHRLRLVSGPEGLSFLLLLVCSVLKRTTSFNAVPVMGTVHGVLFILYLVFLVQAYQARRWEPKRGLLLFVLSVLPTGGFFAERMLAKEERGELDGAAPAAA
ncbi:integral membrane protein [Kitasatospora cineracea]|uniref:Integral membrane protein n=1 Tax=Kitasatospora cineracea TaxID=88074 RepID=A0A3N4S0S6_9ACTN|nr:integral membrane protein [Kitasatospora cineracea]RPE32580.1 integral membrane protein [Kitasatospora cineracea]